MVKQDADPTKELPLADVDVKALYHDAVIGEGKSDASGAYTVLLRNRIWIGRPVTLQLRHPDYQPLDLKEFMGDKLYVARMVASAARCKPRQSSPCRGVERPGPVFDQDHQHGQCGQRSQDLRSREHR